MTIIDDYAHHPTEIKATLRAAKNFHASMYGVSSSHTPTRGPRRCLMISPRRFHWQIKLCSLTFMRHVKTDSLGISSDDIRKRLVAMGKDAWYFRTFDEIENFLLENCVPGDLSITMGAGDVVKIGENLLGM